MLKGNWWLTQFGSFNIDSSEHAAFAMAVMLELFPTGHVPTSWTIRGVPEDELQAAADRGADPEAIQFLRNKSSDPRLYAMKYFGWIRIVKSKWNLWKFDSATAKLARESKDYWAAQGPLDFEMIDVIEFESNDEFSISVKKLLSGGSPSVLKNLAMGRMEREAEEAIDPSYSTSKYSETERKRLYARIGDNPPKRLVEQAKKIIRKLEA